MKTRSARTAPDFLRVARAHCPDIASDSLPMPTEQITFRLRVIIDGELIISHDYAREHAAVRAYDRATALHSIGERCPKTSGVARVDRNFESLKRCDWKPGFGWY